MSDEKIDRIDRRLAELVTITGNLVVGLKNLNDKVDLIAEDQKLTNNKLDHSNKRIDRTTAILEDALSRIIDLQRNQNEIIPKTENLEDRVENIEDKIAA